ncbi:hypothetical protein Pssp01_51610 [Pseudomonas sp. NBRC 100443]|nr:hypothetical protein Pssp01_51610 [Pseudomonas sp. NBRC 100443]
MRAAISLEVRIADKVRYTTPPTPFPVGARPAREIAGRARSYNPPGGMVFPRKRTLSAIAGTSGAIRG